VVQGIIPLQYNPETITRTLQVQGVSGESGDRMEALRLKGPPIETIKLDAEIDATDQLERPDEGSNSVAVENGIAPYLAVLESIVYPTSAHLQDNNSQALMGSIEIIPLQSPLTIFVWSKNRVMPVRITDFSITEEAFDIALNPIRAKVSLSLRVLSINDLEFDSKGSNLFMAYLQQKEKLARLNKGGAFSTLGITGIP
jgi:hypothetical protein